MEEYWGLKYLREIYCPSCGNYLKVVLNGWFHGELFYCPKEKKVFCIQLKNITKNAGEKFLNQCEEEEGNKDGKEYKNINLTNY